MLVVALMGLGFFRHVAQQKYQSFFFQLKKKGVERAAVHAAMRPKNPQKPTPKMWTKVQKNVSTKSLFCRHTYSKHAKNQQNPNLFFQLK